MDWTDLNARAQRAASVPIRPGGVDGAPFWNQNSRAFMNPPAFDFKAIEGAADYRFTVIEKSDGRRSQCVLSRPTDPLTPIWPALRPGYVTVTCEGLSSDGAVLGVAGTRECYRAAIFKGPYPEGLSDYRQSAKRVYAAVFHLPHVQTWLTTGEPPKDYDLYCYPAKILSSIIRALCRHAKAEPRDREAALTIARKMADWLLAQSQPSDAPLANFPPTYWGDDRRRTAVRFKGQQMLLYPAHAANAYFDLAEATGEAKYREAVLAIARTYVKIQAADGTWPCKVHEKDGQPVQANRLVPSRYVFRMFDVAYALTGDATFKTAADRAFDAILKGACVTWNWDGQFEDIDPLPPYQNLQKGSAVDTANRLFAQKGDNQLARELVAWCEDQFVVWSDPIHHMDWQHWKMPTALEQYAYYTPIDASMGDMIGAYAMAYAKTKDELYLVKARALADNITRHQRKDGTIPTYFDSRGGSDWMNCMVYVADRLELLADVCRAVPLWTSASYRADNMPRVYMTYAASKDFEGDVKDLRAHGVDAIEWARGGADKTNELAVLRREGMKALVWGGEVAHDPAGVERLTGRKAVKARCVGGACRGVDIGRHLFAFEAKCQTVIVEPPRRTAKEFFPGFVPVAAEAVVPLRLFDGEQHLKIVPATVRATAEPMQYEVAFDLTGLEDALLDKVGLAVYWENDRNVSVFDVATALAWERSIEDAAAYWTTIGGGTFPSDVIKATRVGDETFNWTARLDSPSESMPFWDFSAPAVAAFKRLTGGRRQYPRTVGCPEIYGEEACGAWLYNWHKGCAALVGRAVRKVHALMPGVICMRNTTRGWTCCWENDWDGTGQELLMRELDAGFLDPYPVQQGGRYWDFMIPQDTEYIAGLARRYGDKPLIPWTQAHRFPGLDHPSPEQIDRIVTQHWNIGFDALFWFGYTRREGKVFGSCELTFPNWRPESWERASAWHAKLAKEMPPKPTADIAVVRPYTKRAICIPAQDGEDGIRHPADRKLQYALRDLAVKGEHFDVFEVPPPCCETDADRSARAEELRKYRRIIRTEDFE